MRWAWMLVVLLLPATAWGQSAYCPMYANSAKIISAQTYTPSDADECLWLVFTAPGTVTLNLPAFGTNGQYEAGFNIGAMTLSAALQLQVLKNAAGVTPQFNGSAGSIVPVSARTNLWLRVGQDGNWYSFISGTGGGGGTTLSGIQGGVPYFATATTTGSSAALTLNAPVLGGGINGPPTSGTVTGNTTKFVTALGTMTSGDCAAWDASGNLIDTGPCLGGPGGAIGTLQYKSATNVFGGYTIGPSFSTTGGVFDIGPGNIAGSKLALGAACFNLGPWTGDLAGAACANPTLAVGAASRNVGNLGGGLTGALPNPSLNQASVLAVLGTPGGDVSGASFANMTVVGLQGFPIASTPPTPQTGLVWNGSSYTPQAISPGITQLGPGGDVLAGPGAGVQTATIQASAVTNQKLANAPGLTIKGNPTAAVGTVADFPLSGGLGFAGGAMQLQPTGFPAGSYTIGSDCWTFNAQGQALSYSAGAACTAGAQLTADDGATVLTADDGATALLADGGGGVSISACLALAADLSLTTGCNTIMFVSMML